MKKGIVFVAWFVGLAFAFAFLGGLMNGLSNDVLFSNTGVSITVAVILALLVAAAGVYRNLLPGTK